MKFEDSGLPSHPTIEKAFNELNRLDKGDEFTTRGVLIAKLVADHGVNKTPEAIAAGLFVPMAQDRGPVALAKADLPAKVPEIVQSVFTFGAASMQGVDTSVLYGALDPSVRTVILASSIRMFQLTADELDKSLKKTGPEDRTHLQAMLLPVKEFTQMVKRAEPDEAALVKKCEDYVTRIEKSLSDVGIKLNPAVKDIKPPRPGR
jgi:hypothetical protein